MACTSPSSRSVSDGGLEPGFAARFARLIGCSDRSSIQALPPIKARSPKSVVTPLDSDSSEGEPSDSACTSPTRPSAPEPKYADDICIKFRQSSALTPSERPSSGKLALPDVPKNSMQSSKREDDQRIMDAIAKCVPPPQHGAVPKLRPDRFLAPLDASHPPPLHGDISVRPVRVTKSSPLMKHDPSSPAGSKGKGQSLRLGSRRSMGSSSHTFLETILQITAAETSVRAGSKYTGAAAEHRETKSAVATNP